MEWVDNMIRAKLFKSLSEQGDFRSPAEQLEEFINNNLISKVLNVIVVAEDGYKPYDDEEHFTAGQLLLIYYEGDE